MQTIYHQTTGEEKILESVDAREHVASGRWAYTRPETKANIVEETFLDEFNHEGMSNANQDTHNFPGPKTDLDGQGNNIELDPTSQEAYEQREALFDQSKSEAEVKSSEVIEEIAKAKKSKK